MLSARVQRVNCRACGVQAAHVPWAAPHGRFTLLFECFALDVLFTAQVQSRAAELLRLTPDQVRYLMQRAVERGLRRRDQRRPIPHLMVDEKSLQAGHHYVSVLNDGQHGAVLEVVEHRTKEAATALFEQGLNAPQKAAVKVVILDMWPPFATAARAAVPQADLVYDRFPLSEHLNAAVDKTRRQEHKRLSRMGDERLKQARSLWLRAPESLSDKQREQLEELCQSESETVAVWRLREEFRGFLFDALFVAPQMFGVVVMGFALAVIAKVEIKPAVSRLTARTRKAQSPFARRRGFVTGFPQPWSKSVFTDVDEDRIVFAGEFQRAQNAARGRVRMIEAKTETILGDADANRYLKRQYRKHWATPL